MTFNFKTGFVKAFSDNPVYFSKSTSKVDRIMKNLYVKNLYIYPRFHVDIESELSKNKVFNFDISFFKRFKKYLLT